MGAAEIGVLVPAKLLVLIVPLAESRLQGCRAHRTGVKGVGGGHTGLNDADSY